MDLERLFAGRPARGPAERAPSLRARWADPAHRAALHARGRDAFGSSLVPTGDDAAELQAVRALLSLADRWTFARALHPEHAAPVPHLAHAPAAQAARVRSAGAAQAPGPGPARGRRGPEHHLRRRDGFKLTDRRGTRATVMDEVDYCVYLPRARQGLLLQGLPRQGP